MIVKVCGMREPANIRAVEECGVDWIGFIFYLRSPRCLTAKPAYLPQKARRIGVFVDAPREEILLRASEYGLHGVQLHGNETPDLCRAMQSAGFKVIKALPAQAIDRCTDYEGVCDYFLFDSPTPQHGGSGVAFDWAQLDRYRLSTPFLLSGGLGPENLAALLRWNHPQWAGIDLNSRFERQPAIKNVEKLHAYISRFRAHNFEQTFSNSRL